MGKRGVTLHMTVLAAVMLAGAATTDQIPDWESMIRPGHVLIMTESGYTPTITSLLPDIPFSDLKAYRSWQIKPLASLFPAREARTKAASDDLIDNIYVVSFPKTIDVREVMSRMQGHPELKYVEPDYRVQFYEWPSDSLFTQQWYLHNTGQGFYAVERFPGANNDVLYIRYGKPGEDVGVSPVFDNPPEDSVAVIVGIIDTGIDYLHPDLADNLYVNTREIPDNGIDDDHNGLVDDYRGWDFSGDTVSLVIEGDNDATDTTIGHGTHVAGLVAGIQNDIGISGYPGRIRILSTKIFPNGYLSVSVAAILYSVDMGARVINASWGFPFETGILREALGYAVARGCLPVAAAGNFGSSWPTYPASFPETFTVGATNADGFMTHFSTYGPFLDIVAPGRDILSLRGAETDLYGDSEPGLRIIADKYILADGTSMSAPIVSGAAAMLMSFHPGLSQERIRAALIQSADDLVDPWDDGSNLPGYDTLSGWGRLNVGAAFALLREPTLYISSPQKNELVGGDITIRMETTGGYSGPVELYVGEGLDPKSWTLVYGADTVEAAIMDIVWASGGNSGYFTLRAASRTGENRVDIRVVNSNSVEITWPADDSEIKYLDTICGSSYGFAYDSTVISYREDGGADYRTLISSTDIFFDECIYEWPLATVEPGTYVVKMELFMGDVRMADSARVRVLSAMRAGFPIHLPNYTAISPGTADIDGDGYKEIVIGCREGVYAFNHDGSPLPGFPVLEETDMRSMPAFDDVDGDGLVDIIVIGKSVVGCFNYRGEALPGWPRSASTGQTFSSYPIPVPTDLYGEEDPVILYMTKYGEVHAYRYNGNPYFYSLGGLFTSLDPNINDTSLFSGITLPFVTAQDVDGNGISEVASIYSTSMALSGVYLWNGRNGLPAFGWESALMRGTRQAHGGMLADVDNNGSFEVVASVLDTSETFALLVSTLGPDGWVDLPGWPVYLDGISDWVGTSPVCADIDDDGQKEIVVAYYGYDISRIYAFRSDGTPYIENPAVPYGMLLQTSTALSNLIVADIDGNGMPNLVCRSGYVFPGTGYEQIFAWEPNGDLLPGYPIVTPTPISAVVSLPFTPIIDDLDYDGLAEMIMSGDGSDLFVWDLDVPYDTSLMVWRKFHGDDRNSGVNYRIGTPTAADDEPEMIPSRFGITANYPNPFNPVTTIAFGLDRGSEIRLEVYNILGQRVKTLASGRYEAGPHTVRWDGTDDAGGVAASGIYFGRLSADGRQSTRKMILLR